MFLSSRKRQKEENEILRLQQAKVQLQGEIDNLVNRKKTMECSIAKSLSDIQSRYQAVQQAYENLRLVESGFGALEEIGYERYVPTMESDDIEKKIFGAEFDIADMMIKNQVILYTREYRIDGSATKGKKFQESYGKNLLIGFNTYAYTKEKTVTQDNYTRLAELLSKNFEKYNKQGQLLGISLNPRYLTLRTDILRYKLELKIKKAKEKAKMREERKRMREQEKLLEEIAKEEAQIKQERKAMDIAFARALTNEERYKIKKQISKLDKRLDNLAYRKEHSKAGWLYIISSPSLPGMIKIGATRRLNPTIRVKELSSSSLPYAFRTHGFVFSNDCFELESIMHKYFDNKRVAEDREFFYVTPKEAIDVLKNKFNQEVHFESEEDEE